MYSYILLVHIVIGLMGFGATALAFGKKPALWLDRAASMFGSVLGSGIALITMNPAAASRCCAGLIVYSIFFAALYVFAKKKSLAAG